MNRPEPRRHAGRGERFYHPELDVLRFVAFLLVFLHHFLPHEADVYVQQGVPRGIGEWLAAIVLAGGFGVDLFFLLSSYLITELLIREIDLKGRLDLKSFYIRRSLRIWPLYFVFVLLTLLVVPFVLPDDSVGTIQAIGFLTFTGNWTTAFLGYPASVIAPLWSVSVEEQFYIVWPLLVAAFGVRRILGLSAGLIAVAFAYRGVLVALDVPHPAIWASTLSRLDPIALGAILAVVLKGRAPMLGAWARSGLILGGLAVWPVCARFFGYDGPGALLTYPLVALGCGAILLGVLCSAPAGRFLRKGPLVYLGQISYGLYVYHILAHHLVVGYLPVGVAGTLVVGFALTLAMAMVSYHVLERPFLKLKQRFTHVRSRDSEVDARASKVSF